MSQSSERWHRMDRIDDRTLDLYFERIGTYPLISQEEEARLARRIRNGKPGALEKLVQANLRFVVRVAKQYQFQGLDLSDLVNAGNFGLVEAAKRFDETRGFKFISYAVFWIRHGILQALYQESRIVRIPLNRVQIKYKVAKAQDNLGQTLRREPTPEEIALELGVSLAEITEAMNIANTHYSLDMSFANEDNSFHDVLEDSTILDPHELLEQQQRIQMVHDMVAELPEREALIITKYFGLDSSKPLTFEQVGELFVPPLSRQRIQQIVEKILELLRRRSRTRQLLAYAQNLGRFNTNSSF